MYLFPKEKLQPIWKKTDPEYKDAMQHITHSAKRRLTYFSPNAIREAAQHDYEKTVEIFTNRFFLFCKLYFLNDPSRILAPLGKKHLILFRWFSELIFQEHVSLATPTYVFLTHRLTFKTLFMRFFCIYTGLYAPSSGSKYTAIICFDEDKIKNDFRAMTEAMKNPRFVADFGNPLRRSTEAGLTFTTKFEIEGFTIGTIRRGINSLTGSRPDRIILDDALENDKTLQSEPIRNTAWRNYLGPLRYSAEQEKCGVLNLGNWLSENKLSSRMIAAASPNKALVMGLFKDGENMKEILWPERYSLKKEKGKISINEMLEQAEKEAGGMNFFRREMLCCPSTEQDFFFDVKRLKMLNAPAEPFIKTVGETDFHIFGEPTREQFAVTGMDTSLGVGLDANTFVVAQMQDIKHGKPSFKVIASAATNTLTQERFAEDCTRFMSGWLPNAREALNVIEANYGGGAIHIFEKEKFNLYERFEQSTHDISIYGELAQKKRRYERRYGLWRSPANKSMLVHLLKMMLEQEMLLIPDKRILDELYTATNLEIAKSHVRRTPENLNNTEDAIETQHLDFIAACVCVAWGIQTLTKKYELDKIRQQEDLHKKQETQQSSIPQNWHTRETLP